MKKYKGLLSGAFLSKRIKIFSSVTSKIRSK